MHIVVGRIRTVYGVKGWLKVQPFTDPEENLFAHSHWLLSAKPDAADAPQGAFKQLAIGDWKYNGKDWLVLFDGVSDREDAARFRQQYIYVAASAMPELEPDEVYLHQLQGMEVYQSAKSLADGESAGGDVAFEQAQSIGFISHILETGAADVIVLQAERGETRMLPYVLGYSVYDVDVEKNRMLIDWVFE